jgi:hypothetical protein
MKWIAIFFALGFGFNSVVADEVTTSKPTDSNSKVIVVQKGDERLLQAPKVFVESGSDEISGSPESNLKVAYRTWEQKCTEFKAELKGQNGANLMVASCGTPTYSSETIQSEKVYTYRSKGTYKIKVVGK